MTSPAAQPPSSTKSAPSPSPKRSARVRRVSKLKNLLIGEPPAIIEGMLRPGEFMIFAADAKIGKTWMGVMLGHAVSSKKPHSKWLGLEIKSKGPVLYFNFELNARTFAKRLQAVCEKAGGEFPEEFYYVCQRGIPCDNLNKIVEDSVTDIAHYTSSPIADSWPKLIIFDSLYNTYGDFDENSNSEMATHMNSILALTRKGSAVVFLHHYNKSSHRAHSDSARASGAHALHRAPDALVTATVVRAKGDTSKDVFLRVTASVRSFPEEPEFYLKRKATEWAYEPAGDERPWSPKEGNSTTKGESSPQRTPADLVQEICDILKTEKHLKAGEIINRLESNDFSPSRSSVEKALKKAVDSNLISRLGNAQYALTTDASD